MPDIIGQETWSAAGKSYVIKVTEPGATVTENAISIIGVVAHRQGDPNHEPLQPILESQLSFTIRDTGKLFQTAIEGKEVGEIVVEFTEDAVTLFKGYLLPEFQRNLVYEDSPTYRVTAYDGIAGLKGFTYDQTGNQTVREQLYEISNKIGLSLQLNSFFDWEHDSADASTDDVDKLRACVEQIIDEESTYYAVLEMLCRFYCAQFFQEDGEWYFMQRHMRGATMTNYPTDSSGSALTDETSNLIYALDNSTLHRKNSFYSKHPAVSRVVSKHKYANYLLKNADWSQGALHWDSSGGDSAGTNGRRLTVNNATLKQTIGKSFLIADSTYDYLSISFQYWFNVVAGTGSHDVDYLEIKATASDGTVRYANSAGAWGASQTYISQNIDFTSHTLQGAFTLAVITDIMPFEPMQIQITLFFDKDASGTASDLDYMEVGPVNVQHITPAEEDDIFRPEGLTVTKEANALGDTLEEEYVFGDTDDALFYGPGVMEYYDGTNWLPTQEWEPDSNTIHDKRATTQKDQLDERLDAYEFSHKFGEAPKLYNAMSYGVAGSATGKVFIPTYLEKTYARNAKVHTRSSSKELLDATVAVAVPATHLWYALDTSIKRGAVADSGTYTTETIVSAITTGRNYDVIRVDQAAEYIFAKEIVTASSDDRHLRRYALDGSSGSDIASWTSSPTYKLAAFALARIAQKIYCMEVEVATNGYRVTRRAYDGTLEETLFTDGDHVSGAQGNGIALSPDEVYLFWRSRSGSNDNFYRHTIGDSAGTATDIHDITQNPSAGYDNNHDEYIVDSNISDGIFCNVAQNLFTIPYPGGGSQSSIATTITQENKLAIDRGRQKFYTIEGANLFDIQHSNYDGSSPTVVVEDSAAIQSIDLGYN